MLRMKKPFFPTSVIAVLCLLAGCSPKILRTVIPDNSRKFALDYTATVVFDPETTLQVTVTIPPSTPTGDTFCFPVSVPGTYSAVKYGKYISHFSAHGRNGEEISSEKKDSAYYILDSSVPVRKITYIVHQTSESNEDSLPLFAGTRIGKNMGVINPYAVFGFFSHAPQLPVRVGLHLPENWLIGTSLVTDSSGYFYADSYDRLQDCPIIAGRMTESGFKNGNKQFFIYTCSDDPSISSRCLKRVVRKSIRDADFFLNGSLPPDYCFLFSITDDSLVRIGALEHRTSSLYGMITGTFRGMKSALSWIIRHELFHTMIPLSLRGSEIDKHDYLDSLPVDHLWFYEGIAQWAAFKMQLINGTMSPEEYLGMLSGQFTISDTKEDTLDFITLSRNVIKKKSLISDVYRRGFQFNTLLDMCIIEKTKGETTLRETILKMRELYPQEHPFPADSLLQIIARLTHPDVGTFLERSLRFNEPVNRSELFSAVGLSYARLEKSPLVKSEFGIYLYVDDHSDRLFVQGVFPEGRNFGYRNGDTLLTVNGQTVDRQSFAAVVYRLSSGEPGKAYTAEVRGKDGELRTIEARTVPHYVRHKISIENSDNSFFRDWVTR
ncbi:MAG: hypothetical protein JW863_16205 [Chitinispirillaceae bacterium]|nr:hypothetical protein [Chitinispirillaceae bacterium]